MVDTDCLSRDITNVHDEMLFCAISLSNKNGYSAKKQLMVSERQTVKIICYVILAANLKPYFRKLSIQANI